MDYELMMNGNVKIGQKAPDFEAITTYGNKCLEDYKGKWLILFSYPGDFLPMCAGEIVAFSKAYPYFQKMNAEILGLSIDSIDCHLAWFNEAPFPLIADRSGVIARKYGMISQEISNSQTIRDVFIIDESGIVKVILSYPLDIPIYVPEVLRTLEALQTSNF